MNRVLFAAEELAEPLPVADSRALHMLRILKVGVGSTIEMGVIGGTVGTATVSAVSDRAIWLDFSLSGDPGPPLLPITCLLGHPRPIVLKRILRDLSAVGVAQIIVCATELGERSYLKSRLWHGDSRWRYLIEGAEQAGATTLPQVHIAPSVTHGLQRLDELQDDASATQLFFDEAAKPGPGVDLSFPARIESPLVYAVGSERGWTERERTLFHRRSWRTVGLGPRVLRVETAAVAAAVMCASALANNPGVSPSDQRRSNG